VGSLLADRLATKGVRHVVGPQALGAPAIAEPSSEDVKAWAAKAGVDSVVVGRTTRVGRQLSLDVRVRSGATGETLGTYVAEVATPEAFGGAVDRLADDVLAGAAAAPAAVGSPAPSQPPAGKPPGGGKTAFKDDAPISIKSDELEAVQKGNSRVFLFSGHVKVTQDNVVLHSDKLEAQYPDASSQPEKLVATGHVTIDQEGKRAVCDQATYENTARRIFCRGNAELRQADDRARGKEIELQLDTNRMFIRGDAEVVVKPREKTPAPAPAAAPATTPAPEASVASPAKLGTGGAQ
jgi:lipopolysaccharide transport protein LptA